jgi:hypothetical protein
VRYRVLDPCFEGDDLPRALEDELNELAGQGWRLVAVVPIRGFRVVSGGEVQVSDDKVEAVVLAREDQE